MATALLEHEALTATTVEHPAIDRLDDLLDLAPQRRARLISPTGEEVELPETVYELLRRAVHHLAQGEAVSIVPFQKELTSQQAADILNVSRPFLIQLLDQGEIPFYRVGTHRRIRFGDLMAYKQHRDEARRAGLRRLTQMSQRMGLYGRKAET